jgi:phosphate transport system substrate-binding protein
MALAASVIGAACNKSSSSHVSLQGAGASFPAPLYERWFSDYQTAHPHAEINYQSVGSGGGIKAVIDKTANFGASDAAMTDEEIAKVPAGVQLVPMTAGSIVLAYNVPGAPADLKLSRKAYTGIFLGKVTKWNDPLIAEANPGATLPDTNISVVWRSDSSGTTYVFTNHLAAVSDEWKNGPGVNKSVKWPVGTGAAKNDGVAAQIKQTPGSIGYIEYTFAKNAGIPIATLENKSGNFVKHELKSAQESLASVSIPADMRAWVPDPDAKNGYPIVTYTWLLCYKKYDDAAIAKALKDVIKYCLTDGQKVSTEMGYVPLPENVVKTVMPVLSNIQ